MYSGLSKLRMTFSVLCLFTLLSMVACESTFDCHHDKCIRGLMYCVDDRQRCYNCADRVGDCDSDRLPRDCDAYCVKVQLESTVRSLNSTVNILQSQNSDLQETVTHKNALMVELQLKANYTRTENDNLQSETVVLKYDLSKVESKLNESEREKSELKMKVRKLEKVQENVNNTFQEKLKSSKEKQDAVQRQFQVPKWMFVGLIACLLLLVFGNVTLFILYFGQRKGKLQSTSAETVQLLDTEKATAQVTKISDDTVVHNEFSINMVVNSREDVKDNPDETSGMRDSRDSGLADSGSNTSINTKSGDKGSSCDLR